MHVICFSWKSVAVGEVGVDWGLAKVRRPRLRRAQRRLREKTTTTEFVCTHRLRSERIKGKIKSLICCVSCRIQCQWLVTSISHIIRFPGRMLIAFWLEWFIFISKMIMFEDLEGPFWAPWVNILMIQGCTGGPNGHLGVQITILLILEWIWVPSWDPL
jgi:hypothetical protein